MFYRFLFRFSLWVGSGTSEMRGKVALLPVLLVVLVLVVLGVLVAACWGKLESWDWNGVDMAASLWVSSPLASRCGRNVKLGVSAMQNIFHFRIILVEKTGFALHTDMEQLKKYLEKLCIKFMLCSSLFLPFLSNWLNHSAIFELGAVRSEKLSLPFLTLKLTSEVNENYPTTDYMTWKIGSSLTSIHSAVSGSTSVLWNVFCFIYIDLQR